MSFMQQPASLGTFGLASEEDLEEFDKPPIPFTLIAYERIVTWPDDVEEAELVDDDGDEVLTEADLDAPPRPLGDPVAADGDGRDLVPVESGPIVQHVAREFEFHVYADVEFGPLFRSLKSADVEGQIPVPIAVQFLADAIVPEERDEFDRVIREYRVKASMIQELSQALAKHYGMNRPTQPRSVRRNGQRHHGRTTEGVRSGPGSN